MSLIEAPHLRLAGVTRLSLGSRRGPRDAFLFDPHRLALPSWAAALEDQGLPMEAGGALLVSLDRHFDLVAPVDPAGVPRREAGLRALDSHARWVLDVRNYDHILAAMEAGLVGDALLLARATPRGAFAGAVYTDTRGVAHRLIRARSVDVVAEGYGTPSAGPEAQALEQALGQGPTVLLDVDLDCFTSPSDADPTEVLPWPRETIRRFLLPPGSEAFWDALLSRSVALTLAREPAHCGGVIAGNRLLEDALQVLFVELLGAELP
jgi:hypothetical protein